MKRYSLGVALAGLVALTMAATAQADPIQALDTAIKPAKLDKKKPGSVKLFVDIRTFNNSSAAVSQDQPPVPIKTVVDFPKNLKIDTESYPHCKGTLDELQNTSPEQAEQICGKQSEISVASGSSSHVTVDTNPTVADPSATVGIPVVLTAFNGIDKNTLIFHNRADAANTTTVLLEKLKKSKDHKYGTSLITNIPKLGAGAPDDFKVTIKKNTVASAVCKSKKNPFQVTTTFTDATPATQSATTQTTCKRKPGKKHHHRR